MGQATKVRSSGEARPDVVLVPMALQPKHTTYEALMTCAQMRLRAKRRTACKR